jgi:O-antigen ligase
VNLPKFQGTRPLPWWVKLLLAYLAAITMIGKGPTYIGVPPFFWGEITLGISLLLIAPWVLRSGFLGRNRALVIVLAAFMTLGAIETAGNYQKWGLDALRDAAIWYYGLFFFVGLALASREAIADRAWWWLRVFWMISLVWNTADFISHQRLSQMGPVIPWRGVPLLFNSVHEAGQNLALGAMIVLCTTTLRRKPIWRAILAPIACVGLAVFATAQGRGMRVAIASGVAAVLLLALARRKLHFSMRLVTVSAAAVPLLLLASTVYSGRMLHIAHLDRFEKADPEDPVGTANWRMIWWQSLYAAVMRTDPAFGLGFGESLHLYHPLLWHLHESFIVRSPHNFNVTVFARMGIVGFALWAAILALGIGGLFRRAWRGTVRGDPYGPERRDELAFWIMMLVATVVNSSFGVLMEGPVLGIWFWFALGFANGRAMTTGAPLPPLERLRRAARRMPLETPREMALR